MKDNTATSTTNTEEFVDVTPYPTVILEHEENRAPKLSYLKVNAEIKDVKSSSLILKIVFDEYTSGLTGGCVRYSLKRADLNVEMLNCSIPYEQRKVRNFFSLTTNVKKEITTESTGSQGVTDTSGMTGNISIKENKAALNLRHEKNLKKEGKEISKTTFDQEDVSVSTAGSDNAPTWTFRKAPGRDFLQGELPIDIWGTINIETYPATATFRLQVVDDDITVSGVEGIWPKDMGKKKNLILRILALKQLGYKPYLSESTISLINLMH